MKNASIFTLLVLFSSACFGAERIKMKEIPESEKEIQSLVDTISDVSNSQDVKGFLNCFTRKKGASVKKQVNAVFQKPIEMSVVEHHITSETDDKIEFDFVYFWNYRSEPKQLITTKVVARKENGVWKIDDSKISKREIQNSNDGLPQDIGRHNMGACADGKCNINLNQNQFNVDPNDGLPQDIGRHNMGACPGGRCNLPR